MPVLRNRQGRIVTVLAERMQEYIDDFGYTRVPYRERGRADAPEGWVAVLRERGGLGDVICVQAVVAGLQDQGLKVDLYTPEIYWPICIADGTGVRTPYDGPLTEYYREVFEMFCPAGEHEADCGMRPREGRIRNFCAAAGVPPQRPPIERVCGPPWDWGDGRRHVGIHHVSANRSKDLPDAAVAHLARCFIADGCVVHLFHDRPLKEVPGARPEIGNSLVQTAAKVLSLDLLIAVDSGLLHLAGALGVPTLGLFGPTNGEITCEFYPSVRVMQCQPPDAQCYAPCYYSKIINRYYCQRRIGECMLDTSWDAIYEEARMLL
jgi:hypothetical protein